MTNAVWVVMVRSLNEYIPVVTHSTFTSAHSAVYSYHNLTQKKHIELEEQGTESGGTVSFFLSDRMAIAEYYIMRFEIDNPDTDWVWHLLKLDAIDVEGKI